MESERARHLQSQTSSASQETDLQSLEHTHLNNSCPALDTPEQSCPHFSPVPTLTERGSLRRVAAICMQRYTRGFLVRNRLRPGQAVPTAHEAEMMPFECRKPGIMLNHMTSGLSFAHSFQCTDNDHWLKGGKTHRPRPSCFGKALFQWFKAVSFLFQALARNCQDVHHALLKCNALLKAMLGTYWVTYGSPALTLIRGRMHYLAGTSSHLARPVSRARSHHKGPLNLTALRDVLPESALLALHRAQHRAQMMQVPCTIQDIQSAGTNSLHIGVVAERRCLLQAAEMSLQRDTDKRVTTLLPLDLQHSRQD